MLYILLFSNPSLNELRSPPPHYKHLFLHFNALNTYSLRSSSGITMRLKAAFTRLVKFTSCCEGSEEVRWNGFHLTSPSSLLFYLDGPTASTTLHLLNNSHPPQNLYTANYSPTTSSHLSTLLPNSYHGPASTVLSTTLSSIPFSGAYLDLCTGKISKMLPLLSCLLPRVSVGEKFVLGVTITNASPCGKSLFNRVIEMEQFIFKQGWEKVERVFDDGEKWGVEGGGGEDGGGVCLWYVLER